MKAFRGSPLTRKVSTSPGRKEHTNGGRMVFLSSPKKRGFKTQNKHKTPGGNVLFWEFINLFFMAFLFLFIIPYVLIKWGFKRWMS